MVFLRSSMNDANEEKVGIFNVALKVENSWSIRSTGPTSSCDGSDGMTAGNSNVLKGSGCGFGRSQSSIGFL